jgi:hypothetical protein
LAGRMCGLGNSSSLETVSHGVRIK